MPPSISISEFKTLVAAAFRLHDELHAKALADSLHATDYCVDELYTPYVPLASRHERAVRQQQTQDDTASIFSRGRGSWYLPSFVFSPASDCVPFTSPRPSSFLPSCYSDTDSSPRARLPLSLKPRQHPSSQDWTLTLDSRSRKRPSISTSHFNVPEEPSRRATTTIVPAGESPPSSPLSASDSQESVDSAFTFTSHPYSNLYSLSLAQREDSSARPPRRKKVPTKPQRKESSASCSKWWCDDDWAFYDEEDEMLYYAASSSLTSFLSFS